MKMSKIITLIFLGVLGTESFAKTGYVDIREAFNQTSRGKKANKKLDQRVAKIRKKIQSTESKLKKEQAQLEKEISLLSQKERARKVQNLQQKFLESKKQIEQKQVELQQLEGKLRNPIIQKLKQVIAEVAQKEGYTVVRDKGLDVLWVQGKMNLTKKVYTRFNKKHR